MLRLLVLFLTLVINLYPSEASMQSRDMPVSQMVAQNKLIVKMAAKELSKSLPQTIDSYTKLIKVKSKGTTLIYVFEINTGAKSDESVKKEDHSRMKKAVTKGVCRGSRRFLDAEITIQYTYISAKTKAELFSIKVDKESCIKHK